MTASTLVKMFEHNNWANLQIIEFCDALPDEQLDAISPSTSNWSIRHALSHLVEAQQGYLSLLTLPPQARQKTPLSFAELRESANTSGAGLLALARDETKQHVESPLRTTDGYLVEPWVVMVQVINHATEHRRQIHSLLSALGLTPPTLDSWAFAETVGALTQIEK